MFVVNRTTPTPASAEAVALRSRNTGRTAPSRRFAADVASAATTGKSSTAATFPSASRAETDTAATSASAGLGVQKLLDTMTALGMSTAGLQISYSEDVVGYPGGSYLNRLIHVTSNGKTEHLSAELTDRNPAVAAGDIQRFLRGMS